MSKYWPISESGEAAANERRWQGRGLQELATVFHDRDDAVLLVTKAGFPREQIPDFRTPQVFWAKIAEAAYNGVLDNGIRRFLILAAEQFPHNLTFRSLLDEAESALSAAPLCHREEHFSTGGDARQLSLKPSQPAEASDASDLRFDLFLSYASEDKVEVQAFVRQLRTAGLTVWMDEERLPSGADPKVSIMRGISEAQHILIWITNAWLKKAWAHWELELFAKAKTDNRRVLPVLRVAWDNEVLGPYLTRQVAVSPEYNEYERLWLVVCGVWGKAPGEKELWVQRGWELVQGAKSFPINGRHAPVPGSVAARLETAYQRCEELTITGEDTTDIKAEILELRREQRRGPVLHPGEFLGDGRFRLVERIGSGGFATVWKAYDRTSQYLVAVKVLHGQFAQDASRRERLFRGSRRMAELHHPNIVRVLVPEGEEHGFYYYVMEYVAGVDLHHAIMQQKLDMDQALDVVLAIASALEVAHARGLVHRDVKPQNILLWRNGKSALTDFDLVGAKDTTGGTRTGALGTVLYAAPEQNEDASTVDHRADIYSLGMTAVFCVYGGKLPSLAMRRLDEFVAKLPCNAVLRRVLEKSIKFRVEDRFDNVESFRTELAASRLFVADSQAQAVEEDPVVKELQEKTEVNESHASLSMPIEGSSPSSQGQGEISRRQVEVGVEEVGRSSPVSIEGSLPVQSELARQVDIKESSISSSEVSDVSEYLEKMLDIIREGRFGQSERFGRYGQVDIKESSISSSGLVSDFSGYMARIFGRMSEERLPEVSKRFGRYGQVDIKESSISSSGLVSDFSGYMARIFGRMSEERLPEVSKRFGRYVVLDELGHGGMGAVFEGYDGELDRCVALKVLHCEVSERDSQRLRREAQALARLSHPNVVSVFEVGESEGQIFIAMELIRGQTLRQWQQESQRDWKRCLEVYLQAGSGLAAAHRAGLIHRDFKPDNALIDDDGRVRVIDFGMACAVDFDAEEEARLEGAKILLEPKNDALGSLLTESGTVMGTPSYMSAEQWRGHEVDARSDQFSFCVSLWEALCGMRPFKGNDMAELMIATAMKKVAPVPRGIRFPKRLRKLLLRGLAAEPAERWPSMDELLLELRRMVTPKRWPWQ